MKIDIADDDQDMPADLGKEVTCCWVCNGPGIECSEFYAEMKYCCTEHREMHHPPDHEEPWPFSVREKEGVGRLLVAARDIDKGELIFTEKALASGPNHTLEGDYCLNCMKPMEESRCCSKCGWPVCSEECEQGENHSLECTILAENKDKMNLEDMKERGVIYWPVSALRMLLIGQANPGMWAIVQRMLGHRDKQKEKVTWSQYNEHLVQFIREKCGLGDVYTAEEVEHVSGVIDVNSIRLATHGHGVYPMTSIMSHSCLANTKTIMNEDGSVDVRAVLEIKRGQEISKSYVSSLETTQLRQDKLKRGWYFTCQCLRCCDPLEGLSFTSAVACLRCREGLILPSQPTDPQAPWYCGDCGEKKEASAIVKLNEYFFSAIQEATDDCMTLDNLLEKAVKMFHPSHYICTLTRIKLNTAFLKLGARNPTEAQTEILMRRKEFLDEVHQVIETIEPGLTQRRGLSLFERAICHLQLGRELYDRKKFKKEDFAQLLETVIANLDDCLECLEHYSVGSYLDEVNFKAGAARDDAELWLSQLPAVESIAQ